MRYKNKGFTLAELLIVVAIIAVLVAISIPIFTSQLEKSREATDLANLRSAYAIGCTKLMTEDPDSDQSPSGISYYMYLPNSGKLISTDAWTTQLTDDERDAAGIGKGTESVGSSQNAYNAQRGIQYDPGSDVSGSPIVITLNWKDQWVSASFW